jgi:asparagine synthase (glutamine-hydrolysing)
MCEVPFGVLLSGGLDSSLIASIASRIIKNKNNTLYGHKLHTFSIGLIDSPDLIAAQKVATYLDTIHHAFTFTLQEGLDALSELIYHLETYDITTIRASTPMFLLSRKIKALGIKMVLSGEGADEIFGGYLYFHQSPSNIEFHNECKKRVLNLHHFDCLRANKSTMAWGLEARVPFLDQEFMEHTMNIHPQHKLKNGIEKYILRKAFDTSTNPYLPESILWRQKEQFSDGVGYGWIDTLIKISNNKYTEEEFKLAISSYSNNVPKTKEALMYREIYNSIFTKNININISQWIPRTDWKNVSYDPSGRSQHIHTNKYET